MRSVFINRHYNMAGEKKYHGIVVPVITPMTENFQPDESSIEKIFSNFYQCNVAPFILGTTGESASLSWETKKAYVKKAAAIKKKGTLLYAGISSNSVNDSIEFAKFCFDNGIDAVAATLPSYYTLTETQMRKYFVDIVNAINGPLIVYNIPATTHMSIPLAIVDELSHHPNVIATKDSERNEERLQQSLQLWKNRNDFSHFLGWAAKSAESLIGGGDGLIPSTGNLIPEVYAAMFDAVQHNDFDRAYEMQELSNLYGNIYQSGRTLGESLWALKVLMSEKKLCSPYVMPPLQPQTGTEEKKLKDEFRRLELSSGNKINIG